MAMYCIYKRPIFPYYKTLIDFLVQQRATLPTDELKIAVNLNIILDAACHIEGVLESKAKSIVTYYQEIYRKVEIPEFEVRKPINTFFNAVSRDLEDRISRCTGIEKYDEFFKLLLGKSIQDDPQVKTCMESIKVLFQLRNVIAHSREISAYEHITDYEAMHGEEFFFGGYKRAEALLLKERIISEGFVERADAGLFFSDRVADYFLEKMYIFLDALDQFVADNLKVEDFFEGFVSDFNKSTGTNFTVSDFLQNVSLSIQPEEQT